MTHDSSSGSGANTPDLNTNTCSKNAHLNQLYFESFGMAVKDKPEILAKNLPLLMESLPDTDDPEMRLAYQLRTLDIAFHYFSLRGIMMDSNYFKQAFTAQKLFRESSKLLKNKAKDKQP